MLVKRQTGLPVNHYNMYAQFVEFKHQLPQGRGGLCVRMT